MTFSTKLNMLPASQRALWKELKATPKHFVLYGGTALALRLGHRVSEDFDFFTNATFESQDLLERIPYLRDGRVTLLSENTLTVVLDRNGPVSVSFFGGLGLTRVSNPDAAIDNGVQVASLLEDAVSRELFSPEFPANREKNREYCTFSVVRGTQSPVGVSFVGEPSFLSRIRAGIEQGIIWEWHFPVTRFVARRQSSLPFRDN